MPDLQPTQQRPKPGTRSLYRHFQILTTRWMDNDAYGHLNNVVYYSLFDTAANAWLIEQGLLDPERSERIGLVVESGCRFHAELGFPVPIEAGLRVSRIGNSSVRYEIGLFSAGADRAAAEGFVVHVFVDRASRKPAPLSAEMRLRFAELTVPGVDNV